MICLDAMQNFEVGFGELTLHLNEYQITGGCLLREQGTAEGDTAVTSVFPKGTRIVLKGKVSPPHTDLAEAAAALDAAVRSGAARTVRLGLLLCSGLRLTGYTMKLHDVMAEVTLVFYTQTPLEAEEEETL